MTSVEFACAEPAFALEPGTIVGNYRLIRRVGSGAMSIVFEGRNLETGHRAAIKCLRPHLASDKRVVRRFLGDAVATANIGHPGLVQIYESADDFDGVAYLAMEYLDGETLEDRLARNGRLRQREALAIAQQLAETLCAVHASGIVHRDIKPSNIFLLGDPSNPGAVQVKLIDFGVAKFAASGVRMSMNTRFGTILGTPGYISPEQGRGERDIDGRSDIYSLGCIMYHMFGGQAPFRGNVGELLFAHQFHRPIRLRQLHPRISESLERLISSMMEKKREDRPATMQVVREAIATSFRNASDQSQDIRAPLSSNTRRPRPRALRILGAVALCIAVVLASAAATHAAAAMGLL